MALGITLDFEGYLPKGPSIRLGRFTGDGAYPAGGYAVTPGNLNFQTEIRNLVVVAGITGFVPAWDKANGKLKFWKTGAAVSTALAEAAAGDITSATIVEFIAWGN